MFYGSYVRKKLGHEKSDIDAVLVFPDDVVINKDKLNDLLKNNCSF